MRNNKILLFPLGLLLFCSCDPTIHQYPENEKSEVVLQLNIDRTPPRYYKEVIYDKKWNKEIREIDSTFAAPYTPANDHAIRVVVDLYKPESSNLQEIISAQTPLVERHVIQVPNNSLPPQDTIVTHLPDGKYRVLAWADYVQKDRLINTYFNADSLIKVRSILEPYPTYIHNRSSATGLQTFGIDFTSCQEGYPILPSTGLQSSRIVPIAMTRPSGRYRLVATDYTDFVNEGGNLQNATVKVVYKQYIATGYDVSKQTPNEFVNTYSFTTYLLQESPNATGELTLMLDYVLTDSTKEDNILVDFIFVDSQGVEINRCLNIEIPLKRNKETIVKGPFLARKVDNGGQVTIDEKFEGEHIINI